MSKFTKHIKRTYEFDGDTVEVVMARMKRKDAVKIAPKMGQPNEEGDITMTVEQSIKFTDESADMLAKYVVSLDGLKEEDGTPIDKDALLGEEGPVYFLELLSKMFADLLNASFVKKDDAKKSEGQSEPSTNEAAFTNPST